MTKATKKKATKKAKPAAWGERKVIQALELTYCEPEYALLAQVRSRTGYGGAERYADAMAFGLWPSRGLTVTGFEIKSSRSDWLRELNNPEKSVAIQRFCDFWYICAGSADIVDPAELPVTWGLMVPARTKMKVVVKAPQLEDRVPPTRAFIASVIRRVVEQKSEQAVLKTVRKEGYDKGFDAGCKANKSSRDYELKRLQDSEKNVKKFEEASGLFIRGSTYSWNMGKIGQVVHMLTGVDGIKRLEQQAKVFETGAETMRKAIDQLTHDETCNCEKCRADRGGESI